MDELWVTDASPVIVLAEVGQAHLLEEQASELFMPEAVAAEILAGPPADPERALLEGGFGHRTVATEIPARILEWGLGRGETEVLALARQRHATAVVDDAAARRCAAALGLQMIGTLGVVLRAKRTGRIDSAAEVIEALRRAKLRIDDQSIRIALASVGEDWPVGR